MGTMTWAWPRPIPSLLWRLEPSTRSVTVNGLGERAGNASLEEVVMAARLTLEVDCGVDTRQLAMLSDVVAQASNRPLSPDKPIVGSAVFRHESGIHCSGLMAHQRAYEPFAAEEVGHAPTELVVGHHSGTGFLSRKLEQLNLRLPGKALSALSGGGPAFRRLPQRHHHR